jgi:hypothetical protein
MTISSVASPAAPAQWNVVSKPSWESIISVRTQDKQQKLSFGMHPFASVGFDRSLDGPQPPLPVWINSLRAGWTVDNPHFSLLNRSILAEDSHASWELSVDLPQPGEVHWQNLPSAYRCLLHCNGQVATMQDGGSIHLPSGKHRLMLVLDAWDTLPKKPQLLANYPNPCNPETWIPYELSEDVDITIRIYASAGQLIRTLSLGRKFAGFYTDKSKSAYWDGRNESGEIVASGVYFYTIQAGDFAATRKMVLAR